MRRVNECQNCGHKHYLNMHPSVLYFECHKCGRQTPAKEKMGERPSTSRAINNPANHV